MPYIGNIVQDFSVNTAMLNSDSVTSIKVLDGTIVNADINDSAAIAGTKISPDFGSQNIVTTGTLGSNHITVTSNIPKISLVDTDNNSDFDIRNANGVFSVVDTTSDSARFFIDSNGTVDVVGNLDIGAGIDVTGAITGTGDLTIDTTTLHVDSTNDRVGIGTASPSTNLHVKGADGSAPKITLSEGTPESAIQSTASGTNSDLRLMTSVSGSQTTKLIVDYAGNVGIGTTSPSSKLSVVEADSTNSAHIKMGTNTNQNTHLELENDGSADIRFGCFGSSANTFGNITANNGFIHTTNDLSINAASSTGNVKIGTGATPSTKLFVKNDGNVGIGELTPLSRLHIEDTGGAVLTLGNSQSPNDVVEGTVFGRINFFASDRTGTTATGGVARIEAIASAAYGPTPSDLLFYTHSASSNDGSVLGNPSERLRLDSSGQLTSTTSNNGQIIHTFKNTDSTASSAQTVEQHFNFNRTQGDLNLSAARIIAGKEREWTGAASNQDGYLAFHTCLNETSAERVRISSAGNVGIGTISPDTLLHLAGADTAVIRLENTDTSLNTDQLIGGFEFEKQDPSGAGVGVVGGLRMYSGVNGITTYLTLSTSNSTTNNEEQVRITSDGQVGIGTTSPGEELVVRADAPSIQLESSNASGRNYGFQAMNDGKFHAYDGTAGSNRVTIDSSGNVGIGTTSPDELLHLSSATPAIRLTDTDTDGPLNIDIESVSGDLYLDTGSVHRDVIISSAGRANEIFRATGDGTVGIGIASPDEILHINKSTGTTLFKASVAGNSTIGLEIQKTGTTTQSWRIVDGQTVNGKLEFYDVTDSETRMCIDGSGNVIVGATSLGANGSFGVEPNGHFRTILTSGSTGDTLIGAIGGVSNGFQTNISGTNVQMYRFHNGSTVTAQIDSDGLKFMNDTAAANALDDYEEGNYVPTFGDDNAHNHTIDANYNNLAYEKIGSFVSVHGRIRLSAKNNSASGTYARLSLPFASADLTEDAGRVSGSVVIQNSSANINEFGTHPTHDGNSYIQIALSSGTSFSGDVHTKFSGNELVAVQIMYRAA